MDNVIYSIVSLHNNVLPGIIGELYYIVIIGGCISPAVAALDNLHHGLRQFLAIQKVPPLEEPMAGMLRIALREVQELRVGRVTLEIFSEQSVVVLQVVLVKPVA